MGIASGQRARPSARPGPCIVQADSKSHTCKLKICISVSFHILVGEAVPLPWTRSRSKKPASLLHPAAALIGSEGSQTAWAVNFTSLVLITSIHHDLGWLDVASKCIDPRLFSVGLLVSNWAIDVNHQNSYAYRYAVHCRICCQKAAENVDWNNFMSQLLQSSLSTAENVEYNIPGIPGVA